MLSACSGGGSDRLDPAPVVKFLEDQGDPALKFLNYERLIIVPKNLSGDEQRLFAFSQPGANPEIYQLSPARLPGLSSEKAAFRFAANIKGEKAIAIYENNRFIRAAYLETTDIVPVTKPEIPPEIFPELVYLSFLGKTSGTLPATAQMMRNIEEFETHYPKEIAENPISSAYDQFRDIKAADPVMLGSANILTTEQSGILMAKWENKDSTQTVKYDEAILIANTTDQMYLVELEETSRLRLHPKLSSGSYKKARQIQITLSGIAMPPQTVTLFVRSAR